MIDRSDGRRRINISIFDKISITSPHPFTNAQRDIDTAVPSVRLSETLGHCGETAKSIVNLCSFR